MKRVMAGSFLFIILCFLVFGCKKQGSNGNSNLGIIPYHPLNNEKDLDILMQQIGDSRIVLLGEASHGTAEYYNWRAALSKRLIQEKGFDFIGIEGEWADSYRVNNFIKGQAKDSLSAVALLEEYDRWPTWMWGNYEVASLVTWMNNYNQDKPAAGKIGFYGLDVYCLWESMTELMPYLQQNDSLQRAAQQVHQCFQPFSSDPSNYSYAVANASTSCTAETEKLWHSLLQQTGNATATTEHEFVMQQNALVALNGERYYRAAVSSNTESWNIRDRHMAQTIKRLLEFHGPESKMIIWEHNTHVGDARYTDMAAEGTVNVGQLVREEFGRENVFIIGTGSYKGSVIAASSWGAPLQKMSVPDAIEGSWEQTLHQLSKSNKIILSNEIKNVKGLNTSIGHRAIGVVYNPSSERGNYVPSIIPDRYDAFMYFDETSALRPIKIAQRNEPPDTYPSGY